MVKSDQMRVTSFFPDHFRTHGIGLSPIAMPRLGQVVVLAGRNGSGKTRTLGVLRDTITLLSGNWQVTDSKLNTAIETASNKMRLIAEKTDKSALQAQIDRFTSIIETRKETRLNGPPQNAKPVDFTPSFANIQDPSDLNIHTRVAGHSAVANSLGTERVNDSTHAYIAQIASLYINATHPETTISTIERAQCIDAWSSLRAIIETLLPGASIYRNSEERILVFGRPIGEAGLSDGQRALLRIAIALHAQSAKLDEAILILDEPENHLHPDALVEFIDRLIKSTPNGQLWIATHSIHVLSFVDPKSLWFVDDGKTSWAGDKPERVLRSLVGDEERVGRLERFIHLPSVLAMERFAAECLMPPAIVTTGAEDRQSSQIYQVLMRVPNEKLRILDYGAGRGRILATLRQNSDNIASRIDYRAYELNTEARQDCIGAVADAYGLDTEAAQRHVYENEIALRERLNPGSVDVVILCNVLHEIPPSEWRSIFTNGILTYCLKPSGHVLILEDMRIPYGENAHKYGFLLLDTEQLQTLFAVDPESQNQFKSFAADKLGRLKAHLVRADALKQVTDKTVKNALNRRMVSAGEKIQELRSGPSTFANGHLLALYTMLYANAALALK